MGNLTSSLAAVVNGIIRLAVRLVFLAMGVIVALSLLAAVMLLLAFWILRAGWAKLTGRPVMPFVMRVDPRTGFSRFRAGGFQRASPGQPWEAQHEAAREPARNVRLADVTDVEPRDVPAPPPPGGR